MRVEPPIDHRGFDALYGLELIELTDEIVRARVAVREELKDQAGAVHGGVHLAIAQSLASSGTGFAVGPEGRLAAGLSNQASFLRPITQGTIHAVAVRRHRGRSTWVWQVEISDDDGELCVLARVTVAVGELR